MNKNEVGFAMRVVPKKKSSGKCLALSDQYREAQRISQPYLFVAHQHFSDRKNNTGLYMLSCSVEGIGMGGDYFKAEDFEPYEDKEKAIPATLKGKSEIDVIVYDNGDCYCSNTKTNETRKAFNVSTKEIKPRPSRYSTWVYDILENMRDSLGAIGTSGFDFKELVTFLRRNFDDSDETLAKLEGEKLLDIIMYTDGDVCWILKDKSKSRKIFTIEEQDMSYYQGWISDEFEAIELSENIDAFSDFDYCDLDDFIENNYEQAKRNELARKSHVCIINRGIK